MPCRPDVKNLPAGVINNKKDRQCAEEDRLDAEEVAGPYRRGVLLEERAPSRRWRPVPGAPHILGDAARRNPEAKPRQLRLDSPLPPEAVFRSHAPNQGPQLWRDRAAAGLAFPS